MWGMKAFFGVLMKNRGSFGQNPWEIFSKLWDFNLKKHRENGQKSAKNEAIFTAQKVKTLAIRQIVSSQEQRHFQTSFR